MTEKGNAQSEEMLQETEGLLVGRAQEAINQCQWVVGECAAKWTKRYARGRTDADFGALIGLSGNQVFQRRRVWETFADVRDNYSSLKWSHFYAALNWDDAAECLQWGQQTGATVAEMKAWRQGGDLLSVRGDEDEWGSTACYLPTEPQMVQDPAVFGDSRESSLHRGASVVGGSDEKSAKLASAARQVDEQSGDYVPFQSGKRVPSPQESAGTMVATPVLVSVAQIVKRTTRTLERVSQAITPEFAASFQALPEQEQNRFVKAIGELAAKASDLL